MPHHSTARGDGLLAVGGSLEPQWLLTAYAFGIFPWFSEGQPILWWFISPRSVLFTDKLQISKSLRSSIRKNKFHVTFNRDFDSVIRNCAGIDRPGQQGTWILPSMVRAYSRLHDMGVAHSVEVWNDEGKLVGGLYGLLLGRIFYGESMFATERDASKVGLVRYVEYLRGIDVRVIDCQQDTAHMRTLGAGNISGEEFLKILARNRIEIVARHEV